MVEAAEVVVGGSTHRWRPSAAEECWERALRVVVQPQVGGALVDEECLHGQVGCVVHGLDDLKGDGGEEGESWEG